MEMEERVLCQKHLGNLGKIVEENYIEVAMSKDFGQCEICKNKKTFLVKITKENFDKLKGANNGRK
jgi:RNase P/RNase MRP subunit p29